MSLFQSTIQPAPGVAGPFFVVTTQDTTVIKVTTGLPSLSAAFNQARDDQGTVIQANNMQLIDVQLKTRTNP
jgi:hypothetical protein